MGSGFGVGGLWVRDSGSSLGLEVWGLWVRASGSSLELVA